MNRTEKLNELLALARHKPTIPNDEFGAWQARVSALIGFDPRQQDRFRHLANSATIPGDSFFPSCMRSMEQILLQAIADSKHVRLIATPIAPSSVMKWRNLSVTLEQNIAETPDNRFQRSAGSEVLEVPSVLQPAAC